MTATETRWDTITTDVGGGAASLTAWERSEDPHAVTASLTVEARAERVEQALGGPPEVDDDWRPGQWVVIVTYGRAQWQHGSIQGSERWDTDPHWREQDATDDHPGSQALADLAREELQRVCEEHDYLADEDGGDR